MWGVEAPLTDRAEAMEQIDGESVEVDSADESDERDESVEAAESTLADSQEEERADDVVAVDRNGRS